MEQTKAILKKEGKEYDLGEWITVARYAERFGLNSPNVVTNWIRRGIIPPENVLQIDELNGIRLVKAVPYQE
ncbi:MAG: hypothetical protein LH609_20195 [Rudanella sp.]|nr:hypothetical protein [Rudanella sp.]